MNSPVLSRPVAALPVFVFDDDFAASVETKGRELGIERDEGETCLRYAARLLRACRLPAPHVVGLLT